MVMYVHGVVVVAVVSAVAAAVLFSTPVSAAGILLSSYRYHVRHAVCCCFLQFGPALNL